MGWEPTRTITVDGDAQTVVTEPEWDEQERDYMTALSAYEDSLCSICGGDPEECQGEGADRRWVGVPPTRCYRSDAVLAYQDKPGTTYERPRALSFHAERRSQ